MKCNGYASHDLVIGRKIWKPNAVLVLNCRVRAKASQTPSTFFYVDGLEDPVQEILYSLDIALAMKAFLRSTEC